MKRAGIVLLLVAVGCAVSSRPPAPHEPLRITSVGFLAPADGSPGSGTRWVEELPVGGELSVVAALEGGAGEVPPAPDRARLLLQLHAEGDMSMPSSLTIPPEDVSFERGRRGDLDMRIRWMVPDDLWDLTESVSVEGLEVVTGGETLTYSDERRFPLVYPEAHPFLAPMLGVWVGGDGWAEDVRTIVYDESGAVTHTSDRHFATMTFIASRARPHSPFLHLLITPGWNVQYQGLFIEETRILDFPTDTEAGTIQDGQLTMVVPDAGEPGVSYLITMRLVGRDASGRETLRLLVDEERARPEREPRVTRRLEVTLFLESR